MIKSLQTIKTIGIRRHSMSKDKKVGEKRQKIEKAEGKSEE